MTTTVLAVLADRHGARSCLEAAFAAAQAVGGEVAALHVAVDPATTVLPTEEILTDDRRAAILREEAEERRAVRGAHDAVAAALGPASFRWIDAEGTETAAVGAHAAGAALIAVAVPEKHYAGEAQEALHAAVFDTGRPVLVVPRGRRHRPVRRVAVGWHEDVACRRVVADARPWLDRAEAIRVLAVDGGGDAALDGARVLFRDLGLAADFAAVDAGAAARGDAPLSAAGNADWLVMGAFRRGRFLDWLFGGRQRNGAARRDDAGIPRALTARRSRTGGTEMDRSGWKFWCSRQERLLCTIVATEDQAKAEEALRNHDAFAEVLDIERVPDKVFALLAMQPGQVTGWSTMNW